MSVESRTKKLFERMDTMNKDHLGTVWGAAMLAQVKMPWDDDALDTIFQTCDMVEAVPDFEVLSTMVGEATGGRTKNPCSVTEQEYRIVLHLANKTTQVGNEITNEREN
tara:strand:+ start:2743 stop:3069 length:327 start_codon:yes stop_codon:yes gene_type:complete